MEHFDIARWTDYLHGFITPPEKTLMERHLEQGCDSCRRLLDLLARVRQDAAAEPAVPEDLVRAAKAIFRPAAAPATAPWMALPRLAAQLIFGGLSSPVMEGARSAAAAEAHIVYRAGDYAIDLQVERDPESNELALVGQLADHVHSGAPIAGVPVLLTAGAKVIARAESNRFGEFCLVGRALHGLTLRVPLESAGKQVVIPLAGLVEAGQ